MTGPPALPMKFKADITFQILLGGVPCTIVSARGKLPPSDGLCTGNVERLLTKVSVSVCLDYGRK